jgi:hypothetical protein
VLTAYSSASPKGAVTDGFRRRRQAEDHERGRHRQTWRETLYEIDVVDLHTLPGVARFFSQARLSPLCFQYQQHETVGSGGGDSVAEAATDLGKHDHPEFVGVCRGTPVVVVRRLV